MSLYYTYSYSILPTRRRRRVGEGAAGKRPERCPAPLRTTLGQGASPFLYGTLQAVLRVDIGTVMCVGAQTSVPLQTRASLQGLEMPWGNPLGGMPIYILLSIHIYICIHTLPAILPRPCCRQRRRPGCALAAGNRGCCIDVQMTPEVAVDLPMLIPCLQSVLNLFHPIWGVKVLVLPCP